MTAGMMKYVFFPLLFVGAIIFLEIMKPKQQVGWENGVFIDNATGKNLIISDGIIAFDGKKSPYSIWIGKGKRFLSPKMILGNMYVGESYGKRIPAEMIMDNKEGADSICSVEGGGDRICFVRIVL